MSCTLHESHFEGIAVNRVISVAVLIGFFAQQFACCCAGLPVTEEMAEPISTAQIRPSAAHSCQHEHHRSGKRSHQSEPTEDQDQHPHQGGHSHHACVGSHLFYLVTERFDLTLLCNAAEMLAMTSVSQTGILVTLDKFRAVHVRRDGGWFSARSNSRSLLCVYRI